MVAEHRVSLEEGNGLAAGVRDSNVSNVIGSTRNVDRKRASSRGCASKSDNGENLGNHDWNFKL